MKVWTTVDKSEWGEGPWQNEPDKLSWTDPATGLVCLIVRGPAGALCGYVGVEPSHPLHGVHYDREGTDQLEAHGGITFSERCQPHESEADGVCHVPEPGKTGDIWWFGFDCAHAFDGAPKLVADLKRAGAENVDSLWSGKYRDVTYVKRVIEDLALQLQEAA